MVSASAKLVVVIPTRNRAALAENAIRSVLAQDRGDVAVLVSDNSTDVSEVDTLVACCRALDGTHVHYVRPSPQLAMCDHWEWALRQALQLPGVTHISFLTDRTVFKPGTLTWLLKLSNRFPNMVISYHQDVINDITKPVHLEQANWSGTLFRLQAADLLRASSSLQFRFYDCLPRMLNCIVPLATFEVITQRYGNVFHSIAPDLCFTYRFLERFDSLLYYDKAILLQYALYRSNGRSQALGKMTSDHVDFLANLRGSTINYAAPVPGVNTNMNTVVHEYCLVKRESNSPKFPEINMRNYFDYLENEIRRIEDESTRRQMELLVEKHRKKLLTEGANSRRDWSGAPALITEHNSSGDAMEYANRHPRPWSWRASNEETMMDPALIVGAQTSIVIYGRFFLVRATKSYRRLTESFRRLLERHVLWRFRSA